MKIDAGTPSDIDEAIACLVAAFARDPITEFLLQAGSGYTDRLTEFLSLLMRARVALGMPVLVARDATGIRGAAMGNSTAPPEWPAALAQGWDRFENATPSLTERIADYEEIAGGNKPPAPHYYLGVIGVDPGLHGRGVGTKLIESFCAISASDPLSDGVYLETATSANLGFYTRAGFAETGRGALGSGTLWCMYRRHGPR